MSCILEKKDQGSYSGKDNYWEDSLDIARVSEDKDTFKTKKLSSETKLDYCCMIDSALSH